MAEEGRDDAASPPVERVMRPLRSFLAEESACGVLLVVAAVIALVWANSPWRDAYVELWHTDLTITLGSHSLGMDLHHWVNDGLMAIFFLVVGLEIKRELVQGELRDPRTAALPVIAAVGGMAVPALLFLAITAGGDGTKGWGIPMATDIAMAVGVLALAGRRFVPPALSLFLLALAIVDDIGAILVIAIFYSSGIAVTWLLGVGACLLAVVALRRLRIVWMPAFVALGVVAWYCTFRAGVHATLAGVVMGLLAPTVPVRGEVSVVERLEHLLHPWSSFVIVPIFALANAGIPISSDALSDAVSSRLVWGIVVGLIVGKPLGICLASWLATRTGVAQLPPGVRPAQILAAGIVAGIGFTVSLFIADLAYRRADQLDEAKLAVLGASVVAGLLGYLAVRKAGEEGSASDDEHSGATRKRSGRGARH